MPETVGKVKLYMGPDSLGGPDNLEDAITWLEFRRVPTWLRGTWAPGQ